MVNNPIDWTEPSVPVLLRVKVPPCISLLASVPCRTSCAKRLISLLALQSNSYPLVESLAHKDARLSLQLWIN